MEDSALYNSTLMEIVPHGTALRPMEEMHIAVGGDNPRQEYLNTNLHWHPEIEIIYIESGSFLGEVNLDSFELQAGDFMFVGSGNLHSLKSILAKSTHEVLIFHPKILSFSYEDELQKTLIAPLQTGDMTFPHHLHPDNPGYSELAPLLLQLMTAAKEQKDGWYNNCKLRLLQLLYNMKRENLLLPSASNLSSPEKNKIERYKRLTSYIENHLEDPLTLDALSALTATNPQYLCRFFREISGQSPIQYLISRRIEKAAALLLGTDQTVLEIAMDCGFDNVSYFIRKFRQLRGMTPGTYRQEMRERIIPESKSGE